MSCRLTPCHISRHVMSRYAVSCYVSSCRVMSCHVSSRHVISCHVSSCHVISQHTKLCHVMLNVQRGFPAISRHAFFEFPGVSPTSLTGITLEDMFIPDTFAAFLFLLPPSGCITL